MVRAQLLDQRVLVRKFTGLVFRIDTFAVNVDVEYSTATFDEPGLSAESHLELGSQTDRPRLVVSLDAVGDGDVHSIPSHGFIRLYSASSECARLG